MEATEVRQIVAPLPTLKSLAAIEAAIVVCTTRAMKRAIFEQPKRLLLDAPDLPKTLLDFLKPIVLIVAKGMQRWYQTECVPLCLDLEYVVHFLEASVFTPRGLIDRRIVAPVLTRDEALSIKHRFKIASFYLLETDMANLWRQMSPQQQAMVCTHGIGCCMPSHHVQLWSESVGRPDGTLDDRFWEEMLRLAAKNFSVVAVETCWQKLRPADQRTVAIRCILAMCPDLRICQTRLSDENQTDIIIFLYLKLTGNEDKLELLEEVERWDLLDNFLLAFLAFHPGPDFLHAVRLCWDNSLLQPQQYFDLLANLARSALSSNHWVRIPDGDYMGLMQVFWSHAPDFLKHYVRERAFRKPKDFMTSDAICMILSEVTLEEQLRLVFPNEGRSPLLKAAIHHSPDPCDEVWFLHCFQLPKMDSQERLRKELELFHFGKCCIKTGLRGVANFADIIKFCLQFEGKTSKQQLAVTAVCDRSLDICSMLELDDMSNLDANWRNASQEAFCKYKRELYKATGWILYLACMLNGLPELRQRFWKWFGCSPEDVERLEEKLGGLDF